MVTLAFAPNYMQRAGGGRIDRRGFLDLSSGILAHRAPGVGRPHGLAQSIFQVGGNAGSAMGPLLAAWIIIPQGQASLAWFAIAALIAIVVLARVGAWYKRQHIDRPRAVAPHAAAAIAAVAGAESPGRWSCWWC